VQRPLAEAVVRSVAAAVNREAPESMLEPPWLAAVFLVGF